jgi:branched-chain amino acid transport system ATP-binding protein
MLQVEDLVAGYGKLQVLNGISMQAKPKEVTVIVGPNGSGKSTLLKSISGLTTVFGGSVRVDGSKDITRLHPHVIARMGVAYLPQTENVFTNLTVHENIVLAGYTLNQDQIEQRVSEVLDVFPQLKRYMTSKTINLSGGERQMLAMAMALLRKPTVIMFDEPTANLAPRIATQVLTTISSLAETMQLTLLLVEQNAKRALEIGDQAYLLVSGNKNFEGTAKSLLEHKEIGRLYLGVSADKTETRAREELAS